MKLKSILLTAAATISLATATMAQVPNYVPSNGLVGWWPFNGNANDESGNGNDGTVNGTTLTVDRFGQPNRAYSFNGTSNYIQMAPINALNNLPELTISTWVKIEGQNTNTNCNLGCSQFIVNRGADFSSNNLRLGYGQGVQKFASALSNSNGVFSTQTFNIPFQNWINVVWVKTTTQHQLFVNGQLSNSTAFSGLVPASSDVVYFGYNPVGAFPYYLNGKLDDIGIWNRALTQQEITDLYNAVNCANNTAITPQTNSLTTGSSATFTATTSDPNPSYIWQSDLGQGYVTLNNYGNYSGVNTATLNVANVQLSEHNQPIRVITTSGNCIDTSNVAVINILDTCLVTVYDTLLTTVTDTLVINTQITGINPPNNLNTLKVYPNPASTHITIDYGNFNAMSGYTLTIVNSIGQTVFTTPINQQTSYIDLSTWTGNGIYFVQLIDPQNNTIENRKIVIQ